MTEREADEVVSILAGAYGMSQRRLSFYAQALRRLPAGPTAEVLEQMVQSEKSAPTIAVIQKAVRLRLENMGAANPVFQARSDRMEQLVVWRAVIEDPRETERMRQDARDRVIWMNPSCQQSEWREARRIAEERHTERNKELTAQGKKPRPALPALSEPEVPGPADPQEVLSRQAHKAGFEALFDGMTRKMDTATLTAHVLAAVRSAERDAKAGVPWP